MHSVSDRISVQGALGTVRYVGLIPAWGTNTVAYGVEWDEPSRGKNSGELDGIQYFRVLAAGSGSFLKASNKKIDPARSFFDAVVQRYAGATNVQALLEQVRFGSKSVESYGFQKLNELLRDMGKLNVIMVDRQNISCAGEPFIYDLLDTPESNPSLKCVFSATTLDLSSNLLAEWAEVSQILRHFPYLQSLNLNGNRLAALSQAEDGTLTPPEFPQGITNMSLSATFISIDDIQRFETPNITHLELTSNNFSSAAIAQWTLPTKLMALDLSFNKIETIPASLNTESLTLLMLADNHITTVQQLPPFPHLTKLDLRRNRILSYAEIDAIPDKFPALRELRINGNPVFDKVSSDETALNLIGRIPCVPQTDTLSPGVRKLNGSSLLELEITNAELYFISKVKSGRLSISNKQRWNSLLVKHGIPETDPHPARGLASAADDRRITLSVRNAALPEKELFSRVFLQKNTVLRLKGIISRSIEKHVLDFSVWYYVNDDPVNYAQEELTDDIASLASLGFMQNHRIYVS